MKRNMKKIASVLLVAMLALCLAACGGGKDNGVAVEIKDATEILTTVWGTYEEDEMFPVGGGDSANMSMEGPAKFDVANTEELAYMLNFPVELADKIDDAAPTFAPPFEIFLAATIVAILAIVPIVFVMKDSNRLREKKLQDALEMQATEAVEETTEENKEEIINENIIEENISEPPFNK